MSRYPYQQGDDLRLKSSHKKMYILRNKPFCYTFAASNIVIFSMAILFCIQTGLCKTNIRLLLWKKAVKPQMLQNSNHILNAGLDDI